MTDSTGHDEQRRKDQQSGQESRDAQRRQARQQYGADQFDSGQFGSGQQGGWEDSGRDEGDQRRRQQQQRDMGSAGQAGRSWGESAGGQQGGAHGYDEEQRRRAAGAGGAGAGYGWSSQGDPAHGRGETRDWGAGDWSTGDWSDADRGASAWRSRDDWRNPGSQSFASDYGMRDGDNYDERFSRQGFGGSGAYSNPGFGRGYGPDYGRERQGADDASRSGGRQQRGFLERAGDEIASWFGSDEAQARREQDYRGHGPADYTRSDERIREDVNDRLTDDPRIDARRISVAVAKGEVTLSGKVASRAAKRRAEDCIDSISGVKHVQNNLRVDEQGWGGSGTSDAAAATTPTSTTGIGTGTSGLTAGSSGTAGAARKDS